MAKEIKYEEELQQFREYILEDNLEKSKSDNIYPLLKKLYPDKFKIENEAKGADVYIEGQLIVECKTDFSSWLEGYYQALHYHKKFGLAYTTVMVIAHHFVGIWKVNKMPEAAFLLQHKADSKIAPNIIGRENAKKTPNSLKVEIKESAQYWLDPTDFKGDFFKGTAKSITIESYAIKKILANIDSDRIQINPHNFINAIERFKTFFERPIDAVHCFYSIIAYWDITSTITERPNGKVCVTGFKGQRGSDDITIIPRQFNEFKKLIETQYIFTNEGSGITVDLYFSRFDEVLAEIDPEYVKQHGIFFTNDNLSKFALWYAKYHFPGDIKENYVVFDPAGGSGNLISSWRGKLKHKIISELQPDLLRTIEMRMNADPFHTETGFTIIPKTTENKGLNFLDRSAADYLAELKKAVKSTTELEINKPIAFLLNPPYKNTDERQEKREQTDSHYAIHPSILELTGEDAGKERYLAFLGQIINLAKEQEKENHKLKPIVMIFTPTSWLIPRPTYVSFRKIWDKYFKFQSGFLVTSNEWFKLDGKWPLAFTMWEYQHNEDGNKNKIEVLDLCDLTKVELDIGWNDKDEIINKDLNRLLKKFNTVKLDNSKGGIKEFLGQKMHDFKRDRTKKEIESNAIYGGLPLNDERRANKKTYGIANSNIIGFMDDCTPVRIKASDEKRFTKNIDSIWCRIDTGFIDVNKSRVLNGATDQKGYCSYDLDSAKQILSWYAITKAIAGKYPLWANQYDIWSPNIEKSLSKYWYSLCFAFALSENTCVVTKFEGDNPVIGAPEIFVGNPLCPTNKESFWCTTLDEQIVQKPKLAFELVEKIKELYRTWNKNYCKGQKIVHVDLEKEPYFKYFAYSDFVTPHSGLIQIKKYSDIHGCEDLQNIFKEISELTKKVKGEIYNLLVNDFKYFE